MNNKETLRVNPELMNNLEKEVGRINTMYFVWQSREEEDHNVDFFCTKGVTKEELKNMLDFFTRAVKHWEELHYEI